MDRSERRRHEQRMKAKFLRMKRHNWWTPTEKDAGLYPHHGKVCSCYMCGNPRKYWGELTIQEKRANEAQP